MKRLCSLVVSFSFLVACAFPAGAHAFLDSAQPAVGSTVKGSPTVVKLWFTRHLKAGSSTCQVFDVGKREVDKGNVRLDPTDSTLMTVSLPKLAAGTYQVTWTAVCLGDGHTTHGTFTFEVTTP